jgi:hypothetical protein
VQDIDQRGTIYTKSSQICALADDIVIIMRSREKIIEVYKEMEEKAGKTGLEINERKTKYMIMSTSERRRKPQNFKIEEKLLAAVSSFQSLGNVINNGNTNNNCVKKRIQAHNRAYFANLIILKSKIISRAAKIQVYKSLV